MRRAGRTRVLRRWMLQLDLRATPPGPYAHVAIEDHVVTMHAGTPARVSCPASGVRCVRERGHVNVYPAGLSEDGWFEDDASETIDLRISASLVSVAAEEMGLSADAQIAALCHLRDPQIEHIVWALAAEQRALSPSGLVYRESLGMALAVRLLARYRTQPAPRRDGLTPPQLARLTEFIEAHLDQDVSLLRLARVAGVSASHLRVLFKRSTGMAVHAYIVRRRVERARELLRRGDVPASQVALDAGFAHQSHMARCMRRVLGVTPSQIRARR